MNSSPMRVPWVDTAKGLSIILVVMMYSAYNTGEYTGGVGFLHYVIGFATPFRMPEFFLISGLFLSQVIDRPWLRYIDRRVVHYLYFYVLWAIISIGLKIGIFSRDPAGMLHDLAMAVVQPYGVLWFIYMLAVFGLAAKLLRQLAVPAWIVIPIAAGLQMWAPHPDSYAVEQFAAYFVFFYVGFVMAPLVFRLVEWTQARPALTVSGLVLWAVVNGLLVYSSGYAMQPVGMQIGLAAWPPLHLVLAVAGAVALCVLGGFLSKFPAMEWLRWLGEHSLVVYVAFTIPMSLFRGAALASGLLTDTGLLSLAVLLVSIISPIVLYFIVQRIGFGMFLFERPAWAHIDGSAAKAAPKKPLTAAAQSSRT
ncbi:acyltransferase family protein [Mesorhizobium sp. BR115XR7A]|uniref:acyltransferase family protein n=1 Tax=Mesorhizobium sp. BR115XR7A TaxID=2876645 RepID=UPI001CCC64F9|nr:acyltransferase family protein [Mesorhizobium sp. BR115XR7A]MBZ9906104.1 acyltransferase family protein [Mesorhizobium sp. BR115XR7A]MBZ9933928.1 acyltransferase family protein [Mesorhizobium sp. BR1-1-5]